MQTYVFYAGAGAFALGCLWATHFKVVETAIVAWLLVALALAFLWRRQRQLPSAPLVLVASVACLFFALGTYRLFIAEETFRISPLNHQVGETIEFSGVVVREPDERERFTQLFVESEDGLILVRVDRYAGVAYGDRVMVRGQLELPESFATDLGRTFNYPGYLKAQGTAHLVSFAEVTVVGRSEGVWLIEQLLSFKNKFTTALATALPEPQIGLAAGLLLGEKRGLGEELETAFRTTGIIHIVVLSGYNIALVISFALYGLAFLLPLRSRLLVGGVAVVCFALLVGLSATVVRASLMAMLLLVAGLLGRTYAVTRALVIAGSLMLVINPYLIAYDVGFQLSFLATYGLIVFGPWLESRLSRVPNRFFKTREFLTATLAAQVFVTPLLLYQIGEFSVVAVLVNLLVLPMVPVAMLLTFMTGMVGLVAPTVASVVAFPTYLSLVYITSIAERFATLPFASFVVPAFPFSFVLLLYVLLAFCLYRLLGVRQRDQIGSVDVSAWTMVETNALRSELRVRSAVATHETPVPSRTGVVEVPVFFR